MHRVGLRKLSHSLSGFQYSCLSNGSNDEQNNVLIDQYAARKSHTYYGVCSQSTVWELATHKARPSQLLIPILAHKFRVARKIRLYEPNVIYFVPCISHAQVTGLKKEHLHTDNIQQRCLVSSAQICNGMFLLSVWK